MKLSFLTLALVVALAGCIPIGTNPSDALFISDLRYESNFRDASGRSYICDNKLTTLSYSFRYNDFARIARWDSRLVGETTGQATHTLSMSKDTGGYSNLNNRISVNWVLSQGTAPLSISPQGIVVTPVPQPRQIGATRLELTVYATNGSSARLVFPGIPVIDNCP
ncbi:hypothetical protein [Meiothermus cerbereus]|uniref:hypothetical protein n=1 Tax=Meiothermus cerbereus TaxID=65552 RepID=UPI003EEBF542